MQKFLSRKFIIALLSLLMGFYFVLSGKVSPEAFFAFSFSVGSFYGFANLSDKNGRQVKGKK